MNWWYKLVAKELFDIAESRRLHLENAAATLRDLLDSEARLRLANKALTDENAKLKVKTPTQEWVETSQVTAAKQRISELQFEIAELQAKRTAPIKGMISGQLELLRKSLENEKAYTLYLEDCLECHDPSAVFNALPLEERKAYFDKVK